MIFKYIFIFLAYFLNSHIRENKNLYTKRDFGFICYFSQVILIYNSYYSLISQSNVDFLFHSSFNLFFWNLYLHYLKFHNSFFSSFFVALILENFTLEFLFVGQYRQPYFYYHPGLYRNESLAVIFYFVTYQSWKYRLIMSMFYHFFLAHHFLNPQVKFSNCYLSLRVFIF